MDLFKMDTIKIAGLVDSKYFDSAAKRFTYLANLNFKGFQDRNEAIAWLKQWYTTSQTNNYDDITKYIDDLLNPPHNG